MKNISPKAKQVEKKWVKPSGKNLGKFFCYIELCNRVISHIQRKNSPNFITVWSVEEPEDERFPTPLFHSRLIVHGPRTNCYRGKICSDYDFILLDFFIIILYNVRLCWWEEWKAGDFKTCFVEGKHRL